jgi:hypothetical protein
MSHRIACITIAMQSPVLPSRCFGTVTRLFAMSSAMRIILPKLSVSSIRSRALGCWRSRRSKSWSTISSPSIMTTGPA